MQCREAYAITQTIDDNVITATNLEWFPLLVGEVLNGRHLNGCMLSAFLNWYSWLACYHWKKTIYETEFQRLIVYLIWFYTLLCTFSSISNWMISEQSYIIAVSVICFWKVWGFLCHMHNATCIFNSSWGWCRFNIFS